MGTTSSSTQGSDAQARLNHGELVSVMATLPLHRKELFCVESTQLPCVFQPFSLLRNRDLRVGSGSNTVLVVKQIYNAHRAFTYHAGTSSPFCPPCSARSFAMISGYKRASARKPDRLLSPWLLQITPALQPKHSFFNGRPLRKHRSCVIGRRWDRHALFLQMTDRGETLW